MCQLTAIKATNLVLLRALLSNQMIVNTIKAHQDGCGISYYLKDGSGEITKSLTPPVRNKEFWQEFMLKLETAKYPVLAHVRQASTKVKDIQLDHAHPFYNKESKITFAHNGTLLFQDSKRQDNSDTEFPNMIDSQIFFEVFNENLKKTTSKKDEEKIVEALNTTMELFYGKFAFLLEKGKTIYVARGRTALLHQATIKDSKGEVSAILINTELDSLRINLMFTLNTLRATGKEYTATVEELDKETIYKLEGTELVKIGTLTQREKIVIHQPKQLPASTRSKGSVLPNSTIATNVFTQAVKTLVKTCHDLFLLPQEFDQLLIETIKVPLAEVVTSDLRDFRSSYFRFLKEFVDNDKHIDEKRAKWRGILAISRTANPIPVYNQFALQFPYFLNSVEELTLILEQAQKAKREPF